MLNHYLFVALTNFLAIIVPFSLPAKDTGDKIEHTLSIYLLLVAYKFATASELPVVAYHTLFDKYMLWTFCSLFTF